MNNETNFRIEIIRKECKTKSMKIYFEMKPIVRLLNKSY